MERACIQSLFQYRLSILIGYEGYICTCMPKTTQANLLHAPGGPDMESSMKRND